jgi:hypothetical protein
VDNRTQNLRSLASHPAFKDYVGYLAEMAESCRQLAIDPRHCPDQTTLSFLQGQHLAYKNIVSFFNQELPLLVQQQELDQNHGAAEGENPREFRRAF